MCASHQRDACAKVLSWGGNEPVWAKAFSMSDRDARSPFLTSLKTSAVISTSFWLAVPAAESSSDGKNERDFNT